METFTLIFDISRGGPLTFDIYRTLAASLRGLGIPPRAGSINYDRKLARTKMETYTLAFFYRGFFILLFIAGYSHSSTV
jgi:hypothetical protein